MILVISQEDSWNAVCQNVVQEGNIDCVVFKLGYYGIYCVPCFNGSTGTYRVGDVFDC